MTLQPPFNPPKMAFTPPSSLGVQSLHPPFTPPSTPLATHPPYTPLGVEAPHWRGLHPVKGPNRCAKAGFHATRCNGLAPVWALDLFRLKTGAEQMPRTSPPKAHCFPLVTIPPASRTPHHEPLRT